jgi:hypothetical protein
MGLLVGSVCVFGRGHLQRRQTHPARSPKRPLLERFAAPAVNNRALGSAHSALLSLLSRPNLELVLAGRTGLGGDLLVHILVANPER